MIRHLLTAICLFLLASTASATDKFDGATALRFFGAPSSRSDEPVRAMVLLKADAPEPADVKIEARYGDVLMVEATPERLQALARECPDVVQISAGRTLKLCNNLARAVTGAVKITEGAGLEQPYTGQGVLTGLYDIGFDGRNPSFWADGKTRVKRIYQFTDYFGTLTTYTVPVALRSFITDSPENYHGTHVLGTMSGATGGLYDGFAGKADIAFACGPLTETNMASGLGKMAAYAVKQGQPCVLNLSVSDVLGPHDGSDVFAQALTGISQTAAMVVSAGNDGDTDISICRQLDDAQPDVRTFLIYKGWPRPISGAMAVWSADSEPLTLTLAVVDRRNNEILSSHVISPDTEADPTVLISGEYEPRPDGPQSGTRWPDLDKAGADCWVMAVAQQAPSGKRGYYIEFDLQVDKCGPNYYPLGIIVGGKPGQRAEVFLQSQSAKMSSLWTPGWSDGANDLSISSLCCAHDVISVGAFVDRVSWLDESGATVSMGDYTDGTIAPWSSYGTIANGTKLPTVAAPGASLISVLSTPFHQYYPDRMKVVASATIDGRSVYWAGDQGTSMSAPAVAGSIATWLEADPALTSTDILEIIRTTATVDDAVRAAPDRFGAGKFDAYAGLKEVLRRKAGLVGPSAPPRQMLLERHGSSLQVCIPGVETLDATLTDAAGRTIRRAYDPGDTITFDISSLAPGMYIVSSPGATPKKIILAP